MLQKQASHRLGFYNLSPIDSTFSSLGPEQRFCESEFMESKSQKETAKPKMIVWYHIGVQKRQSSATSLSGYQKVR